MPLSIKFIQKYLNYFTAYAFWNFHAHGKGGVNHLTELKISYKAYQHTRLVQVVAKFILQYFCHCLCGRVDCLFNVNIG